MLVAARTLAFRPCADGKGKWHASTALTPEVALCGRTSALLDPAEVPVVVAPGTDMDGVHPILCRSCLRMLSLPREATW